MIIFLLKRRDYIDIIDLTPYHYPFNYVLYVVAEVVYYTLKLHRFKLGFILTVGLKCVSDSIRNMKSEDLLII